MLTFLRCSFIIGICFLFGACNGNSKKAQLKGEWRSKDGETILRITGKEFIIDNGAPLPEDYFVKDDTIFTSFEGSQPYTRFIIKKLTDHELTLFYPDSVLVEYAR